MKSLQLKIYDVLGNEIATLANEEKPEGDYEIEFNGTGLPSGVYFYRLVFNRYIETKKCAYQNNALDLFIALQFAGKIILLSIYFLE